MKRSERYQMLKQMLEALGAELPPAAPPKFESRAALTLHIKNRIASIVHEVNETARHDAIIREKINKAGLRPGNERTF